jgi:hypothetical protein
MTLGQKQRKFAECAAHLILKAYEMGYEVTLGDAYRDPRAFGAMGQRIGYGRSRSNHKVRLAIDLNLFKDGQYLTSTEDHRPLGMWWETEYGHLGASWGGHFNDGNHYSFEHEGRR